MIDCIETEKYLKDSSAMCVPTGVNFIDENIGGILSGDLFVIEGKEGVGKTAYAFQIALNAAQNCGRKVLFVSNEMSVEVLMRRQFPAATRFVNSNADEHGKEQLSMLLSLPMKILDYCSADVEDIDSFLNEQVLKEDYDFLVLDSLQSVYGSRVCRGNRVWVEESMVRSLKSLVMDLGISCILTSHCGDISRYSSDSGRCEKSETVGQLADSVVVISPVLEDTCYSAKSYGPIHEIRVMKTRHGKTCCGPVSLECDAMNGPHFCDATDRFYL